jgi:predicted permease
MSIPLPRVLDELRQDLRFAARTTLRTRGFLVAALSLGAAVGATTSIYATADWLLNRPPRGVVEPERLLSLAITEAGSPEVDEKLFGFSFGQFTAIEHVQDAFTDVAAYSKYVEVASADGWEQQSVFQFVTGAYFGMLEIRPHLGRLIGPEDDVDGTEALAVLSHAFWQSHFGGDPDVVGRTFRFASNPVVVIGVLPPGWEDFSLDWIGPTHVWLPMRSAQRLDGMPGMLTHTQTYFRIMGRLRDGIGLEQAREMAQRWLEHAPALTNTSFTPNAIAVRPAQEHRIARRAQASTFLGALFLVCVLVLLAASANVANYLLGRAAERRREMAVRTAVGAARSRIIRQVLTESALLASVTSALAVGLGAWLGSRLAPLPNLYLGLTFRTDPISTRGAVDGHLFALALGGAFALCIALGLAPLLGSFRDPASALRRGQSGWSWGRLRISLRQSVLVLQVGLGLVLAISATLLGRSLHGALTTDPEYADPSTLFLARLEPIGLEATERGTVFDAVRRELDAAPEVVSATMGWHPPFAGGWNMVESLDQPGLRFEVGAASAGPRYFETLGIDVVAGTEFPDYGMTSDQVIINEQLAEALWPGQDPVGRRFRSVGDERRVVGVVARQRCRTLLGPPSGCLWSSYARDGSTATLRVRTAGPASEFTPVLEGIVDRISPDLAIVEVQTMEEIVERMTRPERVSAAISTALALFGIALLAVGFASVFVAMVRDSRREIAIRMALGATDGRLAARVTGQGLLLLVLGSALGLWLATLITARLGDRLIGVSPTDPASYAFATLVTLTVGLAAAGIAARMATRTEPAVNLRAEG